MLARARSDRCLETTETSTAQQSASSPTLHQRAHFAMQEMSCKRVGSLSAAKKSASREASMACLRFAAALGVLGVARALERALGRGETGNVLVYICVIMQI